MMGMAGPERARSSRHSVPRHHDVEDDEIWRPPFDEPAKRHPVLGRRDAIALLLQILSDQIADLAVVVDDGDVRHVLHGGSRRLGDTLLIASSFRPGSLETVSVCNGARGLAGARPPSGYKSIHSATKAAQPRDVAGLV
jgi:hypothetical protein